MLTNWHFMRYLRLGLGLFIAYQAVSNHDTISGFIAVFFLFQAVTDTGCGGTQGCGVERSTNPNQDVIEDVQFEEIKEVK